jgi:hypothetical protein
MHSLIGSWRINVKTIGKKVLAAEQPERQGQYGAQEQAGHPWKINRKVLPVMDDVAGQFAGTKGQPAAQRCNDATNGDRQSENDQRPAYAHPYFIFHPVSL